jgi:adenylylsulfate kinase
MMKTDNDPFALWLLGPTSSGKTTLAAELYRQLVAGRTPVLHFDGDEIRDLFGVGLQFDGAGRMQVVKSLVHFANKAITSNINVIVSALTANSDAREYVNQNVLNLKVGYVECGIDVCAERDPKGLYQKAKRGEIDTLIGYNTPYLAPDEFDFKINTEKDCLEESVCALMLYLNRA